MCILHNPKFLAGIVLDVTDSVRAGGGGGWNNSIRNDICNRLVAGWEDNTVLI